MLFQWAIARGVGLVLTAAANADDPRVSASTQTMTILFLMQYRVSPIRRSLAITVGPECVTGGYTGGFQPRGVAQLVERRSPKP
jgi:hypothetical protein